MILSVNTTAVSRTFRRAIAVSAMIVGVTMVMGEPAYTDPAWLAKRYGIGDRDKVFKKMAGALNKFTDMATKRGGLAKQ